MNWHVEVMAGELAAVREGRIRRLMICVPPRHLKSHVASGTQLIQELVAEGVHAVTRYQPQSGKIMRMHAQTAMIENGFVHLPKEAAWLAEYLHELTVFPKGKHDDQVDSTAQMLDWFKRAGGDGAPTTQAGIWYYYKELYEAQEAGRQTGRPEPLSVMAKRLGIFRPL